MRIRLLLSSMLAFCLIAITVCSTEVQAIDRSSITYDDIRNTGQANDCPTLPESARGSIELVAGGNYQLREMCLHPEQVYIKGEPASKRQEAKLKSLVLEGQVLKDLNLKKHQKWMF